MSKKKKQNLQKLIAKKQQLQQVAQGGAVVSFSDNAEVRPYQEPPTEVISRQVPTQPKITADRALRHTAISIVVIVALLVIAVIFDKKSPYLNQFGSWLYSALKLQS